MKTSFSAAIATRLSGVRAQAPSVRAVFVALARLSLLAGSSSMLSGCLIEDPPPYTKPAKTPPRLDLRRAVPAPDQFIVKFRNERIQFNVPVASEDDGEDLLALLLFDYQGEMRGDQIGDSRINASTLDDASRKFDFTSDPISASTSLGCHRITMRVSHYSNYIVEDLPNVRDPEDVAEAYWWLKVVAIGAPDAPLTDCPQSAAVGTP